MKFAKNDQDVINDEGRLGWHDLLNQVRLLDECAGSTKNQWIFRALGKWESQWWNAKSAVYEIPVTSSFDDAWNRRVAGAQRGARKLYESWILLDFKREAHNYLSHPPHQDDFLEWMALGRHYGMPSRLGDFTYSFPVAAYFALSERKAGA